MSIHRQKTVKFAFDIPSDMHRHLKVVCAEDSVPMNAFVTKAIAKEFLERAERLDEEAVDQAEKAIEERGTMPLADWEKTMG